MPRTTPLRIASVLVALALLMTTVNAGAPPPTPRTLTEQELVDMMLGSSIQASRGDNTADAVKRVKEALAQGRTFTMIPLEDMPDDWTVVTAGVLGGGGAWQYVRDRTTQQKLPTIQDGLVKAIETLGKYTGKKFDAVLRVEAASATLGALQTASTLGVPVVDACLSGRSRPEVAQTIPFINGLLSTPAALVTRWGDTMILDKAVDDYRFEDLARAVAVGSGGSVSVASRAFSGRQIKRAAISGSMSQAILFGRTVREARAQGKDPVAALIQVAHAYKLFHGIVTKAAGKGEGGFDWWDVELKGIDEYAGHTYKVYVKNENLVTWLDGVPDAMSPDYIADLEKTGDTHYSGGLGGYKEGAEIVMVGWPASPLWRTAKGIEVFGPRHFGFDFNYVPVEQLQKQRKVAIGQ